MAKDKGRSKKHTARLKNVRQPYGDMVRKLNGMPPAPKRGPKPKK